MTTPTPPGNGPHWAARTDFDEEPHALAQAIAAARASGQSLVDLTVTNPTHCGFMYDHDAILQALAAPAGLRYDADPLGMAVARESVTSRYYAARGLTVDADRLLLTSSTSEGYGYLLRLLCDVNDEILVPQPSYPLFDLLARFHDVRLVPYPLLLHDGWRMDLHALRRAISPRTRAIVLVHPNNPTGHTVVDAEREIVERLAQEFGLALIVDEVFLDFAVEGKDPVRSFTSGPSPVLTFVLSGLSKVLALPQMKLAWTAVVGPAGPCAQAMRRLELIADTFLSPNAPVQHAVGSWLALAPPLHADILSRVRANLAVLDRALRLDDRCSRLPVHAGWSVLVRVPGTVHDEETALELLQSEGVMVHPGSFYGLPARGWLVLSLIVPTSVFEEGVRRVIRNVARISR